VNYTWGDGSVEQHISVWMREALVLPLTVLLRAMKWIIGQLTQHNAPLVVCFCPKTGLICNVEHEIQQSGMKIKLPLMYFVAIGIQKMCI